MKSKKEKSLSQAIKLISATKGRPDTASILKEVVREIEQIKAKNQAKARQ